MNGLDTLVDFIKRFSTERACLKALIAQRWPEGFCCPRCKCEPGYWLKKRRSYECADCGYQASVTAGTVLQDTHTSLQKWFIAIYLMVSTPKAPSTTELERQLGVTHKTAWSIRHKIMRAMSRRDGELMLCGMVEMDEAFIGGREREKRGRGVMRKTLVAVSVDHTSKGGCRQAHMQVIPDAGGQSLTSAAKKCISPSSVILTDGWSGYNGLPEQGYHHQPWPLANPEDAVKVLPWVHITISNFKRWILDIFHGVSSKHLQFYLEEFCYRLNRRWNRADLFRRVLNRCLLFTTPLTYKQLIAS
jgi:transposase-like protein